MKIEIEEQVLMALDILLFNIDDWRLELKGWLLILWMSKKPKFKGSILGKSAWCLNRIE